MKKGPTILFCLVVCFQASRLDAQLDPLSEELVDYGRWCSYWVGQKCLFDELRPKSTVRAMVFSLSGSPSRGLGLCSHELHKCLWYRDLGSAIVIEKRLSGDQNLEEAARRFVASDVLGADSNQKQALPQMHLATFVVDNSVYPRALVARINRPQKEIESSLQRVIGADAYRLNRAYGELPFYSPTDPLVNIFLSSSKGERIVFARRSADGWFIGATNWNADPMFVKKMRGKIRRALMFSGTRGK